MLGGEATRASVPGEIVLASEWYDETAKYAPGGMDLVVPARISAAAAARVRAVAIEAFDRVGASGLARADFFVDGETVLLNELNTMPGFTATSVYAKLWEATGISYPALVDELCRLGIGARRACGGCSGPDRSAGTGSLLLGAAAAVGLVIARPPARAPAHSGVA